MPINDYIFHSHQLKIAFYIIMKISEHSNVFDGHCERNLTIEETQNHTYTFANRMFVTVGIPIVLTLGLLGNIGFLIVIYRIKSMRNATNYYLANLAVADLCLLVMTAIQYFWTYTHSPLDVNFAFETTFGCALPNFIVYFCYFASVWLVTLVAAERYLAICYPLRHHTITGSSRSFRLLAIAWCLSLIMTVFASPYGNPEIVCMHWPNDGIYAQYPAQISVCRGICAWCDKALYVIDPAQFIFALIITTCMYGRIVAILSRRTIADNGSYNSAATSAGRIMAENRNQVARMLIINTVVFFVCLMPYCITNLDSLYKEITGSYPPHKSYGFLSLPQKQVLSWISKLTTQINSAANPYLYSATNRRYRKAFVQTFEFSKKSTVCRRRSSVLYSKASTGESKL